MFFFEADDFGRPGGGGGAKLAADPGRGEGGGGVPGSEGTRFERVRGATLLLGGDTLRSMAEADRAGGGTTLELDDDIGLLRLGEAV